MSRRGAGYGVRAAGFFGNRIAEWAPGADDTAGQVFGWTFAYAGDADAVAPSVSGADLLPPLPRMRFTASGANGNAGIISQQTVCWRGNAAALGGFHFGARFSLTGNFGGTRAFVGLSAQTSTLAGASDPTAANNTIGVGFVSGDADTDTWRLVLRDAATSSSNAIAGATRTANDVFDLSILCAPNASTMIVRLVNLTTNTVLIDDVSYASADHIPQNSVFLTAHVEIGAAASGESPTIDLVSMFIDVPDGARTWAGVLGTDGVYNLRDFGAVGDGTTADDAAFAAAVRAIALAGGGTLLVPPGTYKLDDDLVLDLDIAGPVTVKGVGPGSGHSKSRLQFAAYKGVRVRAATHPSLSGPTGAAAIEDLDIFGGHVATADPNLYLRPPEHAVWEASTSYDEGAKVLVPGPRFQYNGGPTPIPTASFEYYYENVRPGAATDSDASMPSFSTTQRVDPSTIWAASTSYNVNDVVRVPGNPGRFDVFFVCTVAGTSGAGPMWNYTVGTTTNDGGTLTWKAFDAAGYFVADGGSLQTPTGPVWACRVAAGIYSEAKISVNRVLVQDFLNAGLHIQSPPAGYPRANDANASTSQDLKVFGCGGGILTRHAVRGGCFISADVFTYDSDQTGWTDVQTDRSIGLCERSDEGNTYVSCQVALTQGPCLFVSEETSAATFVGCYMEALGPVDARSPKCSLWGGVWNAGQGLPDALVFTDECEFYGAPYASEWRNVASQGKTDTNVTIVAKLKPDGASVYGFSAGDDATDYKLTYDETSGWWEKKHGSNVAIAYSGANATEGGGFAWTPRGIFVGSPKIMITNGTAAPGGGSWRQGDIVINRNAASGQPSYWQYADDGGLTWLDGPSL